MKKLLYCAAALAMAFFAGSCQQENLEPVQEKNTVTFTVEAPANVQTKAIADGLNVDQLVYEVWITGNERNQTELANAEKLYQSTTGMEYDEANKRMKATITLDLVNDQNFTVLFWAQKSGINVYNTANLTGVTYTNTAANAYSANDNNLDAFYAKAFVIDGATTTPTVTLRRPFAQVNLCTENTKDNAQVPGNYNIALVSSKMRLDAVPTVFNVSTSNATGYVAMEFAANTVPSGEDKMITVNGKEYYYAGMNYVFAGANIRLTYDIQTKLNGTVDANVNNTITNVPLKENYRTNIVGNLLTSKVDYEIIVDERFNEPDTPLVSNGWAHVSGYDYTVNGDAPEDALAQILAHADAAAAATKAEGPEVTIDLNGDVYWKTEGGHGSSPLLPATSNISKVVINGNGNTFTATGAGVGSIRLANRGLLEFNDVNVVDKSVSYNESAWEFTYLEFAGNLSFNGCTFNSGVQFQTEDNDVTLAASFANCRFISNEDSVYAAWISDGTTTFTGCSFEGTRGLKMHEAYGSEIISVLVDGCAFGPLSKKPGIAMGDLNNETSVTIKNSTFTSCQSGDYKTFYETDTDVTTFTFVEQNNKEFNNPSELLADVIANATESTVEVPAGEYTFPASSIKEGMTLKCAEGTVFQGASSLNIKGATVEGATFSNPAGTAVGGTINGTFKDCVFDGSNGLHGCYAGETTVFENCVFTGDLYGVHFDGGEDKKIIFKDCIFSGFNAFAAKIKLVTFDGCTFKSNGRSGYNGANLWGSTKMINTEFIFDGSAATEWVDCIAPEKSYSFTGCTINGGSALNPDYIRSRAAGTKIVFDGVEYIYTEGKYLASSSAAIVTNADAFKAALAANEAKIVLMPGIYEGTFHVTKDKEITSADSENKAMIKGRVHVNSVNATFANVNFDRNETNSNEPNNTASNALQYKAVVMIYGDQTHTIKFEGCKFQNNNGAHKSAITNVACDLIVDNCYFEGTSSSIYSQANLSVTNSTFNYTGGNNVILSINGCGKAGGKVIFKGNVITNKIFALSQFLSTVGFGDGLYHFDVQGNTGAGFDHYFLNVDRVANKTFAEGSETF